MKRTSRGEAQTTGGHWELLRHPPEPKAEIIASLMLVQDGPRLGEGEHWLPGESPISTVPPTGITNVPYIPCF